MILVMDVGNTGIVSGIYEGRKLIQYWRMRTDKDGTSDEFGMFMLSILKNAGIEHESIEAVVIASVVPPIMYSLGHAVRKYFDREPLVIGPGIKTGINIKYENPREVGADRIANAVAAFSIYGGPVIIVDFGTATTFCAVSSNAEYLGGVISPGIKVSSEALFTSAAKLPRIELARPKTVIGRNIVESMQSGIYYGFTGQVDYMVKRIKDEMGEKQIRVVATGGLARLIASESAVIDTVNGNLALEGLRIIYEMNRS